MFRARSLHLAAFIKALGTADPASPISRFKVDHNLFHLRYKLFERDPENKIIIFM